MFESFLQTLKIVLCLKCLKGCHKKAVICIKKLARLNSEFGHACFVMLFNKIWSFSVYLRAIHSSCSGEMVAKPA